MTSKWTFARVLFQPDIPSIDMHWDLLFSDMYQSIKT